MKIQENKRRNPVAKAAIMHKGGIHIKPTKSIRTLEKQRLRKDVRVATPFGLNYL